MKKLSLSTAIFLSLFFQSFTASADVPTTASQEMEHIYFLAVLFGGAGLLILSFYLVHRRSQRKKEQEELRQTEEETKKEDKSKKPPDYILSANA